MTIQATGAMALVVGSVPEVHLPDHGDQAVFTLAILTGVIMLIAGLLKLGSLIRFVPNAVMTGFVNAVAMLIILGQLEDFTGYSPAGGNKVAQTIDLFFNLDQVQLETSMVGLATIFLILMLEKTWLGALGMVAAMIVASLLVPLFGWDSVQTLNDIAEVPGSLPCSTNGVFAASPATLTHSRVTGTVLLSVISLTLLVFPDGTIHYRVGQNYANPDGTYPDS